MGVLPWSHHALGDLVDAPKDAPATYTNYWGYEIELLKSIAEALNFKYDIAVKIFSNTHIKVQVEQCGGRQVGSH